MLQRTPVFVGDLKPIGVARPLPVVRPVSRLSSWATISISCLSTLALFASGAAWLVPRSAWTFTTSTHRAASVMPAEAPPPAAFPSWVEVPHLTGPLSTHDDLDASPPTDGPRTFLDPNPADTAEQPVLLPPRVNPRLPLIGRAPPLDAAQLTHEQPPVWNERTERRGVATSFLTSVVATLEPNVPHPSLDQAESGTIRALPVDPTSAPILRPRLEQARTPAEVVVRSAPTISVAPPPGRVATLSPDPAQQVVERTSPITMPRGVGGVVVPILNPGPARHARSLWRPRAAIAASRARAPYRDTEQTASIISMPTSAHARVDAGAVAHASMHRARADPSAGSSASPAPSSPWTLPPALAPTD